MILLLKKAITLELSEQHEIQASLRKPGWSYTLRALDEQLPDK